MIRRLLTDALLVSLMAGLFASPALAQSQAEDLIEPTDQQVQLSTRAYDAFIKKEWGAAIDLYQTIIDLGPLNSAYASLGFALFKDGRCEEARDALDQAEYAPRVTNPPPEQVDELLRKYRQLLLERCEGRLIVDCPQRGVTVSIDGQAPTPCDDKAIFLMPGEHKLRGSIGEMVIDTAVFIEAMGTTKITLEISGAPVTPNAGAESRPNDRLVLILGGVGATVLIAAATIDLTVLGPSFEDFRQASARGDLEGYDALKPTVEAQQSLVRGLLFTGIALTGAAATLLSIDLLRDEGRFVQGWLTPSGAGISLAQPF